MRSVISPGCVLVAALLAACGTDTPRSMVYNEPNDPCGRAPVTEGWLDAIQTNQILAGAPEHCQPGAFILTVRSYARIESVLFLNSELDYHDPKNITLAVLPRALEELSQYFHDAPDNYLLGKQVVVVGTARRVRTYFNSAGPTLAYLAPNGDTYHAPVAPVHPGVEYYYQSHILVESAGQMYLKQPVASK